MSNTERRTRVRYSRLSREDRTPKNTLVTVREGNTVYFGIARCNRKLDTFHRTTGTHIATQRALLVASGDSDSYSCPTNRVFRLHKSGLRGSVPLENVKEVINYFRTVDEYCLDLEPKTRTAGV